MTQLNSEPSRFPSLPILNDPKCPNCGPDTELIEDYRAGDLVCEQCGTVVGDRVIDVKSEWRTFGNTGDKENSDPNRVGAEQNPLLEHLGLSTTISKVSGKKSAAGGSAEDIKSMSRLNKVSVSLGDRNLLSGFKELTVMADRINLPQTIVNRAQVIYSNPEVQKLLRGRASDAMVAACLYLACRWEKVPRTFKEICALTNTQSKHVVKAYKKISQIIDVGANIQAISTDDFMARFCCYLKLPIGFQKIASHVASQANDCGCVAGKSPISVVAASIYMVCLVTADKRSAKDIGAVSGVSESTIKQCIKEMHPHRMKLFPASPLIV
eukprot:Sdes_comp17928_c0_seq1m7183